VEHLIQRYGYRKTSVEDIAQEAKVSRATAYLYFASKEALVMAWIEQRDRLRLDSLQSLAQEEGSVPDRIARFLLARVMTRFDDAQPYVEGIDELLAALRARVLEHRNQHYEAEALFLANLLREGIQNGDFVAQADPLATARLLVLGTNSLLPYNLSVRAFGEREAIETSTRGLIALLLGGLTANTIVTAGGV
jgi:AcrR family transcriptional regulator